MYLKRRFIKDPQFFEEYQRQIEEFVSKFYAKKADVRPTMLFVKMAKFFRKELNIGCLQETFGLKAKWYLDISEIQQRSLRYLLPTVSSNRCSNCRYESTTKG